MKAAEALATIPADEAAAIEAWEIPPVPDEIVDRLAPVLHELEDRFLAAEAAARTSSGEDETEGCSED